MPFITDLLSKVTNLRIKIGDKLNILKREIGQLNSLTTDDKTSLVEAVNEVNTAIYSEVSKKLDAPKENATNEYVLMADGSVVAKSKFGIVDKVMGVESDSNKNVDISGVAMNWTNANQQFSGLEDKSADATYDKVMVLDSSGKAGVKDANDLTYIPLTGTEEGKPLTGSIGISPELSEPLFKRGKTANSYSEFLTLNNGFNYLNSDRSPGRIATTSIVAGVQTEEYIMSTFGHSMLKSGKPISGVFTIKNDIAYMNFSGGVTSGYNMDDLKPDDYNMFAQRSYVMNVIANYSRPTNWTSSEQRFSGLVDKSADETYELFALFDSDGNLAKASNIANAFEASLTTASDEQRLKIGKLLNVGVIHVGFIQDYYGDVTQLPVGWSLCDGTNGTPDLRGMFIIGYDPRNDEYNEIGKTGGAKEVILKLHQIPMHNHSGTTSIDGGHTHEYLSVQDQGNQYFSGGNSAQLFQATTSEAGSHSHSFYTSPTGGGQPHENRPPFYVLAKIMYTG